MLGGTIDLVPGFDFLERFKAQRLATGLLHVTEGMQGDLKEEAPGCFSPGTQTMGPG